MLADPRTGLGVLLAALGLLCFAPNAVADPGDISTVAGTGTPGYSGDGGAATSAGIGRPYAISPTGDGGFLIADGDNQRIRKVSAAGVITTVAGNGMAGSTGDGGPATAAKLNNPSGVAATPDGGFLIAANNKVRKVFPDGTIDTVAGTGVAGFAGDGGPATAAQLDSAISVEPTADGGFLIGDWGNHRVRKVSAAGIITTVAGTGTAGFSGDGGPATSATLDYPVGLTAEPDGGFLISDGNAGRVRNVSPSGIITRVAGGGTQDPGDGGLATDATLFQSSATALTADGGYLIADQSHNRVRKVSPSGIISTVAGTGAAPDSGDGGPATLAHIYAPHDVAVLPDGGFLIADELGYRVRRVEGVTTPTVLNTDPASPAAATSINVAGTAEAGTVVNLFTAAGCVGPPVATGTAAQFASPGIPVAVAEGSTNTFFAQASANGYTSACSATGVSYSQRTPPDTKAPNTKLGRATIKSGKRTAKLRFTSTESRSTFQCRLDRQKKFSKCRSPKTYKHLKPGKHTFRVRAIDLAGNVDTTPAKRSFRIRR